jgi:hypothetical protein
MATTSLSMAVGHVVLIVIFRERKLYRERKSYRAPLKRKYFERRNVMKRQGICSLVLFVCLFGTVTASAVSWDLYGDMSFSTNPVGQWSYGLGIKLSDQDITSIPDTSTLTLFDKVFDLSNSSPEDVGALGSVKKWALASLNVTDALLVKHTPGSDTHAYSDDPNTWRGVPQGQAGLMPGKPGRNYPIVARWTAPEAGTAQVHGSFGQCMGTQQSGRWIKHNSTVKFSEPSSNSAATFNFPVTVAVGDKIDFIVTQGSDLYNDSTPLVAQIDIQSCSNLSQGVYLLPDLNHDCYIDFADIAIFVQNWLTCNDPQNPEACAYTP